MPYKDQPMKKWYTKITFLIMNKSETSKNNKIHNASRISVFGMNIRKNNKLSLTYLTLRVVLEFKCLSYALHVYTEAY